MGTSGHCTHQGSIKVASQPSLLSSIKIIKSEDMTAISASSDKLGEGRFGSCHLKLFSHFKVCVKKFKKSNTTSFINEANIMSSFNHCNLPYLFGVCVHDCPALIISYHGFNDKSVTLHSAVLCKSDTPKVNSSSWIDILKQVATGLDYLHTNYKIIHNDIKSDNICLTATLTTNMHVKAVIIDFGKACIITQSKSYKLTKVQKEKYKENHPHIAPDLRDGLCQQSVQSDIFSFGRIIRMINNILQKEKLEELANECIIICILVQEI